MIDRINLQVRLSFVAYLACIAFLTSSWETSVAVCTALIIHEAGHCLTSFIIGERIARIELTPFGGIIHYANGKSPCKGLKGLCVAASGPMSNYLILVIISVYTPIQTILDESFARVLATANLSMMLLNLFPAFPLDGGRIVFSFGYFLFPASRLITFLSIAGIFAGIAMMTISILGFAIYQKLNLSILIIGGYLIAYAVKSRNQLLAENLFAIVHEHLNRQTDCVSRVDTYYVPPGTRLIELLSLLERSPRAIFQYEYRGKEQQISDRQICSRLLENPFSLLQEYDNHTEFE